jgi:MFS family permease
MVEVLSTQGKRALRPVPVLALMTLVQVLATAAVLALTALAPRVAGDLGVGVHWIGYQVSLVYLAGMLTSASAAEVGARLGPERMLALVLLLLVAGLALLAQAALPAMALGTVLIGLAYGLNNPAASDLLERVTPLRRRGLVFSVKQAGVPLGAILVSLTLPPLTLALDGRWPLVLILMAGLTLATLGALPLVLGAPPRPRTGRAPGGAARSLARQVQLWRDPPLRALAAIGGLYSAVQLIVTAFAVVTLVDLGWSVVEAGAAAALIHAAGVVARPAWGLVADRIGAFRVLTLLGVLIFVMVAGLAALDWLPRAGQAAWYLALGLAVTGWNGVMLAATADCAPPGQVGARTGTVLVWTFVGVTLGPALFAALAAGLGDSRPAFVLVAGAGLVGAALAQAHVRPASPRSGG